MALKVFVSSVSRGLEELRRQLWQFVESAGHTPIYFESADFDKMQRNDMMQTCLEKVESCHAFVLVIGREPGYVVESLHKTVTHLELLKALSTNKTVFAFAERYIFDFYMNEFQAAKTRLSENGNTSPSFDEIYNSIGSPSLKRDALRIFHEAFQSIPWMFKFDSVEEIKNCLLSEFSALLATHVQLRNKNQINSLSETTRASERFAHFNSFYRRLKPYIKQIKYEDIKTVLKIVQSNLKGGLITLEQGAGIQTPMVNLGDCHGTSVYKYDEETNKLQFFSGSGLANERDPFDPDDESSFVARTYRESDGPATVNEEDNNLYVCHKFGKYVFTAHFPIKENHLGNIEHLFSKADELYSGIMSLQANISVVEFFGLFLEGDN
ncbi:DUF4062 domain-containing protein [Alicyclobacillus fastidiosus]|uniref:DUF4062 domain-containing protein n=1 Tax=Alicyclobacillus fastidiosus TaxID=392011 RepID=A0ABV5ALZ5_9BACL|nr:DUF4062 domain-containing protein [Alicyclobacillus fastidiosus]WEH10982.1 DUF4062 domain-containing protein [Alicyclobacillus fastidiosus]